MQESRRELTDGDKRREMVRTKGPWGLGHKLNRLEEEVRQSEAFSLHA